MIISLAILQVNWDVTNKDYLDNFVPFVAECILRSKSQEILQNQVRDDVHKNFGLQIPLNVIKSILKKLRRKGLIRIEKSVYYPNRDKIRELEFNEKRSVVLEQHKKLIEELINYARSKFNVNWDTKLAEDLLFSFIHENLVSILNTYYDNNVYETKLVSDTEKFIVASFITEIQTLRDESFYYLETIVKGSFLVNAIYITDIGKAQKKFQQTQFYFDTSFIIFALGYAGEPRKEPCIELLKLLKQFGGDLYCFSDTVDETRGILQLCASRYMDGDYRNLYGRAIDTCEYFLQNRYTDSDILLILGSLEKNILSLGIKIVEKPKYDDDDFIIGEEQFSDYLQDNIRYASENALYHDTVSISSIIRLREGKKTINVEDCKSVFVTTNNKLAMYSAKYFIVDEIPIIPPCVSDSFLTNIVWLKNPTLAPELPQKRIIADCFAAQQLSEEIWIKYICKLEELLKNQQITIETYYFLRTSIEAKSALIGLTKGDSTAFTNGTMEEIMEHVKNQFTTELKEEIKEKNKVITRKDEEIDHYQEIISGNKIRKEKVALKLSNIIFGAIQFILIITFLGISILSCPFVKLSFFSDVSQGYRWAISGISFLFQLISILSLFTGFFINKWLERVKLRVKNTIQEILEKKL